MRKIFYILFISFLFACSSNEKDATADISEPEANIENGIKLSKDQISLTGITTGKMRKIMISETIECTGFIEVPAKQKASISPIISGFIKTLNYNPGEKVEKGAILASLQHPDFINLQQQYIEAKGQKEYFEQEFKRQGELTVENAASIKKMQKAKADYSGSEAKYKSLKSQLELLGINPETIEKGDFVKEFKLIAPISGTISQLNANNGKYVNSENCIYEIIDNSHLNVSFSVFEKDIAKIKKGQKVEFHLLNNEAPYKSTIKRIGAKIDIQNRTTLAHGTIENKDKKLKPGMHIVASILINDKDVFAIPSNAIIENENESFIFVKKNDSFVRIKIEKGIEQNNYCEIIGFDDKLKESEIVVEGAYYLMSAMELNE